MKFYKNPFSDFRITLSKNPYQAFECKYILRVKRFIHANDVHNSIEWDNIVDQDYYPLAHFVPPSRGRVDSAIKKAALDWLNQQVGPENVAWARHDARFNRIDNIGLSNVELYIGFKREEDALLFKLTWE